MSRQFCEMCKHTDEHESESHESQCDARVRWCGDCPSCQRFLASVKPTVPAWLPRTTWRSTR